MRQIDKTKLELQACFHCTHWSVFETVATDLDKLTVTASVRTCVSDNLNVFYCRFANNHTPHSLQFRYHTQPMPSPRFSPLTPSHLLTGCVSALSETEDQEGTVAQMVCHPPVWESVLTSWPPSSHRSAPHTLQSSQETTHLSQDSMTIGPLLCFLWS